MKAAENPFRSSAIAELRYRIADGELAALAGAVVRGNYRQSCLLGPEGSGKTTLLEDLEPSLREHGARTTWIRLNRESSLPEKTAALAKIRRLMREDVCLLDGGEVLSWWKWKEIRRLSRSKGFGLVATLHRSRGLPVLREHLSDWSTTRCLVASLAGPLMSAGLEEVARRVFESECGNVREVFRACYMACAKYG